MTPEQKVREAFRWDKNAEFIIAGYSIKIHPARSGKSGDYTCVDVMIDDFMVFSEPEDLRALGEAFVAAADELALAQPKYTPDAAEESQDDVARRIHLSETGAS